MSDSSLRDVDLDIRSVRVLCDGRAVGTLALSADGVLAFEYDDAWLGEGFSISPLSLPLEKRVFVAGVCWSIGCFDLTASIRSP